MNTLADLDTTKRESSDAQALAAEADAVRAWVEKAREVNPSRAARVARVASIAGVGRERPKREARSRDE